MAIPRSTIRRLEQLEARLLPEDAPSPEQQRAERLFAVATLYEDQRAFDILRAKAKGAAVTAAALAWHDALKDELKRRLAAGLTAPPPAPEESEESIAELAIWFEANRDRLPRADDGLFVIDQDCPWVHTGASTIRIALRPHDRPRYYMGDIRSLWRLWHQIEDGTMPPKVRELVRSEVQQT